MNNTVHNIVASDRGDILFIIVYDIKDLLKRYFFSWSIMDRITTAILLQINSINYYKHIVCERFTIKRLTIIEIKKVKKGMQLL